MFLVPKSDWRPSSSLETLKQRAKLIQAIRQFFINRNVLEVETPLMCSSTVTDVHIESIAVTNLHQIFYLQTSPEYAMKRLLAAGSGNIFQICKAFRAEEQGKNHNCEFTMLEWYRVGFNHHDLMSEVEELLQTLLGCSPAHRISYQELFNQHLNINPHTAHNAELQNIAKQHNLFDALGSKCENKDDWLHLLFSHLIEPKIGFDAPYFVMDYPESQASLAKINNGVAERFEVYVNGIELANGFHELQDHDEQSKRFDKNIAMRNTDGKPLPEKDENFLAALEHGLPDCAGVALGVDRLLMIALEKQNISEVVSFGCEHI